MNVLKNSFTGPIATGLSLVAIVVGGLSFAYGEGHSKKGLAGIIFGVGMAIGAGCSPERKKGWRRIVAEFRRNPVYKSMNRPLTILGAERRLFFVALIAGAGVFNLLHTLLGALIPFVCGLIAAQWATKYDTQILRVLLNSAKFNAIYDPAKYVPEQVSIRTTNVSR